MPDKSVPQPRPGHDARRPTQLGMRGTRAAVWRAIIRIGRDQIGLIAAGVAFYALLAIFPTIAALVAMGGLVIDPVEIAAQLETGTAALPPAAREILIGQARDVADDAATSLNFAAIGGLAFAVYSSGLGVFNLIAGLNVAYEEVERRGFIRLTAVTLALSLFLVVVVCCLLAVVAVLPAVLAVIDDDQTLETVMAIARWPILLVIGGVTFTTLYRFGPSRRAARWRWLAPGGVFACLVWILATAGFGWYVETLGAYTETFGALAGVIVLLLWLWLSAFAVLTGAVLDAEIELQTARDSTIGPPRPMGERGAVKADNCPSDA